MIHHQFPVKKATRLTLAGLFLLLFTAAGVCLFIIIGRVFQERPESFSTDGCASSALGFQAESSENANTSDGYRSAQSISTSSTQGALSVPESIFASAAGGLSAPQDTPGEKPVIISDGSDFPLIIEPEKTRETIEATAAFFLDRVPALNAAIADSGYFSCEKLLDPNTDTWVYMIAQNEACASNMNGYFYYLFEKSASSLTLSPFILDIAKLFQEENRESAVAAGTFSDPGIRTALRQSLIAALGSCYKEDIFDFIITKYVQNFEARLHEDPLDPPVYSMKSSGLEIIFHCSFLTYVEFYVDP